jgi:hypothetical protein
MRELNEQELELVTGGYSIDGKASAGSKAYIKLGIYDSTSKASVHATRYKTKAYAKNSTFAAGYGIKVESGATSSVG